MKTEDKELLLKDLCGRLPYEVILAAPNERTIFPTDGNTAAELFVEEGWKPYLRSLSSMTEEECIELGNIEATIENVSEVIPNVPYYIEVAYSKQIDWLNAHHFDYRGLIKKGLAIAVTKENNPYKEK